MTVVSLRPSGFDELGLRRALSDRLLPFLVAAMAFLAALALAGWVGAASLARDWQAGSGSVLTIQVPHPSEPAGSGDSTRGGPGDGTRAAIGDSTRVARVLAVLAGTPGIESARQLTDDELAALLRPWLGTGGGRLDLPLPAVIAVRLSDSEADLGPLTQRLTAEAPGVLVEGHGTWIGRLTKLARSLQACAGLALLLVVVVAAAVVAVATRSGLSVRRQAIEIVHGLGATDSYIAGRFAARATLLATVGGLAGAVLALPVLVTLAGLASPFTSDLDASRAPMAFLAALPTTIWASLVALPAGAAAIGFLTAQGTVRRWLRRMP
ncbi:MAG: cell division protein FtsX [Acetobacteraceae bacterium]|nr:cell division protein FtsX [Acetobacteraceae bacterium]